MWDTLFSESIMCDTMIIHCPKESDAIMLTKILDRYGVRWGGSLRPASEINMWGVYKENTCYWLEYGELGFGSIDCAGEAPEYDHYIKCTFRAGCDLPDFEIQGDAAGQLLV